MHRAPVIAETQMAAIVFHVFPGEGGEIPFYPQRHSLKRARSKP